MGRVAVMAVRATELALEQARVLQSGERAIEPELADAVQLGEPIEEQAPEQHAEDAHRQEEGRTR